MLINYLIHNSVGSDDVVGVRPQAGEGSWGIGLHFLSRTEGEDE